MSKFNFEDLEVAKPKPKKSSIKGDIIGAVNYTIGTGKHAQDSVVWLTIRWSFCLGLFLSTILIWFMWPANPEGSSPVPTIFPIDQLTSIWSIFVPIVTLALGYMFGKGR
ncbi:hypothetical protein [Aliivibrio fischeri]|uniref:hypothetical protein n=1 Tax=Aliivibrio fischeri TaxID=668 RepID=UPI0007C4A06C|nr:hypothetical protein [Aliivibrio fischeri]